MIPKDKDAVRKLPIGTRIKILPLDNTDNALIVPQGPDIPIPAECILTSKQPTNNDNKERYMLFYLTYPATQSIYEIYLGDLYIEIGSRIMILPNDHEEVIFDNLPESEQEYITWTTHDFGMRNTNGGTLVIPMPFVATVSSIDVNHDIYVLTAKYEGYEGTARMDYQEIEREFYQHSMYIILDDYDGIYTDPNE